MYPLEGLQLARPFLTNHALPALVGVSPSELRFGRQVESPQARAALQLIQAFERSSLVGVVDLRRLDVSAPGILQVTTGQGTEVIFGLAQFEVQLRRWHAIHEHAQRLGRHLAWVDLSVANNVPARWSEAAPSEVPPPVKPLRYRKRHV
jgi:cell division septal protein FtsQ